MKQNNFYWALFAPMIKSGIKKRFGDDLAETSIKNGKGEYQHAKLYRVHTIASGDGECDYWIVGDKRVDTK